MLHFLLCMIILNPASLFWSSPVRATQVECDSHIGGMQHGHCYSLQLQRRVRGNKKVTDYGLWECHGQGSSLTPVICFPQFQSWINRVHLRSSKVEGQRCGLVVPCVQSRSGSSDQVSGSCCWSYTLARFNTFSSEALAARKEK